MPGLAKATGLRILETWGNETLLLDEDSDAEILVSTTGRIEIRNPERVRNRRGAAKAARAAAAALYMASYCLGCGLCKESCPYNAFTEPLPRINPEKCRACRLCINACPATNQADAVESIVHRLLVEMRRGSRS